MKARYSFAGVMKRWETSTAFIKELMGETTQTIEPPAQMLKSGSPGIV